MPILSDIVPGGFTHSANYLVEFEPNSLWYETSLTIAAQALKAGVRTQYHTFMHVPVEVREALQNLTTNLESLENEDRFRLKANGEVALENLGEARKKEIGISGWLKGPKKNRRADSWKTLSSLRIHSLVVGRPFRRSVRRREFFR